MLGLIPAFDEAAMRVLGPTVLLIAAFLAGAAMAQDGAATFNAQCKSCHALTGASGPAGPGLKGVVGRKVAGAPGYAYSKALTAKGGVWTDASLDAYLANPAGVAPGGKMFTRVGDGKTRAALIAWLKTWK